MTPVEERIDHAETQAVADDVLTNPKWSHEVCERGSCLAPTTHLLARHYKALLTEHSAVLARLDGEGPQVSMGTAAGILGREVEARKDAEQRVNVLRKWIGEEQADRILSAATKETPCQ